MGDNGEVLVPLVDAEPDYFFGIDKKSSMKKNPPFFTLFSANIVDI